MGNDFRTGINHPTLWFKKFLLGTQCRQRELPFSPLFTLVEEFLPLHLLGGPIAEQVFSLFTPAIGSKNKSLPFCLFLFLFSCPKARKFSWPGKDELSNRAETNTLLVGQSNRIRSHGFRLWVGGVAGEGIPLLPSKFLISRFPGGRRWDLVCALSNMSCRVGDV